MALQSMLKKRPHRLDFTIDYYGRVSDLTSMIELMVTKNHANVGPFKKTVLAIWEVGVNLSAFHQITVFCGLPVT